MRTLIIMTMALGLVGAAAPLAPLEAQPPADFTVPRLDRVGPHLEGVGPAGTHELMLPADVVARPGESPLDALARALSDEPEDEARP